MVGAHGELRSLRHACRRRLRCAAGPHRPERRVLYSGLAKLVDWQAGLAETASLGLPYPKLALAATVLVQLGGGLMVLLGIGAGLGAASLAAFIVVATVITHAFWIHEGPARAQQLTVFLEQMAIAGGFLLLIVLGPGWLSLDRVIGAQHRPSSR
jgi:putative oxidoreductase